MRRKKVKALLGEELGSICLFELSYATGRSRSSLYRDMKSIDIKPKKLIKNKFPVVSIAEAWKFTACPWFHGYADDVRSNGEPEEYDLEVQEDTLDNMASIFRLSKIGLSKENLLDLVVTGFLPCIKVPGDCLCNKDLLLKILENYGGTNNVQTRKNS